MNPIHGDLAGLWLGLGALLVAATVVGVAGVWRTFVKAGRPGWAALIPVYSIVVLSEIARSHNRLFFTTFDVARAFGRSAAFGVGLAVLPFIFYPVLGFGSSTYLGPVEVNTYGLRWGAREPGAVDPRPWTPPSQRQPEKAGTSSRNPLALLVSPLALLVLISLAISIGLRVGTASLVGARRNPPGLPATLVTVSVGQKVNIDPSQLPDTDAASVKVAALTMPSVGSGPRTAVATVEVCRRATAGAIGQASLGLFVLFVKEPTGHIPPPNLSPPTFATPLTPGQCQQGTITWSVPGRDTVLAIDYFQQPDKPYRWIP
jgi:hypothetical protein